MNSQFYWQDKSSTRLWIWISAHKTWSYVRSTASQVSSDSTSLGKGLLPPSPSTVFLGCWLINELVQELWESLVLCYQWFGWFVFSFFWRGGGGREFKSTELKTQLQTLTSSDNEESYYRILYSFLEVVQRSLLTHKTSRYLSFYIPLTETVHWVIKSYINKFISHNFST